MNSCLHVCVVLWAQPSVQEDEDVQPFELHVCEELAELPFVHAIGVDAGDLKLALGGALPFGIQLSVAIPDRMTDGRCRVRVLWEGRERVREGGRIKRRR